MNRLWAAGRWALVAMLVGGSIAALMATAWRTPGPSTMRVPFELWYGNWRAVLLAAGVFTLFLVGFTRPRRRVEWRNAGIAAAFFISLFTEMFGIPLTIYLIAPLLGLPPRVFGSSESHLLAFALHELGVLHLHYGVYVVMVISMALVAAGLSLLVVGWATVYRGRERLVTRGVYRHLRHPQYLGLILTVIGFNIQWPTLATVLMAPILVVMYLRLARSEDLELATFFGEAFLDWAARTPAFVPWGRGRVDRKLRARVGATAGGVRPAPEAEFGVGEEAGRLTGRRGLVASLAAGAAALVAAAWGWRRRSLDGRGYQEVARWGIPGGQGRFVALDVEPTVDALRALGERLRQELDGVDNAVVMVFDDAEAARTVRQGSRVVGEERFQAALAHQRAMYTKQPARGEHALAIYARYPEVADVVRYDGAQPGTSARTSSWRSIGR